MQRFNLEITVGLFVVLGLLALGYLSVQLGQIPIGSGDSYSVSAIFSNVAGLRRGAMVEIAGVRVGRVEHIVLEDYEALVTMRIDSEVELQEDSIASIKTSGLIGEKFIRLTPGGSDKVIGPNGRIRDVESPLDFEEIIGQFIQGKL